jgi:hypothetical protein
MGFEWFEIEKINSLASAIFAKSIGHPHELRACPRRVIGSETHSVSKKLFNFILRAPFHVKPAVKRFASRMDGANQRSETREVQKQSRVLIGRALVKFANEKLSRPCVGE